ncbi:MAG TPA: ribosome maturation factor RimM [Gammaproteobacteria bacterium]|nr:ribosome maturation factor RimM [Gammaproteobacteria bacterium]
MSEQPGAEMVTVGRIAGLYGVRGWVKVYSYTEPRENILTYSPWYLRRDGRWQAHPLAGGRRQGKGVTAHLDGFDDRDAAAALVGVEVAVRRDQLPAPPADEYYWSDLIGLEVVALDGRRLGRVDHLLETGANDVLVVDDSGRERLIPYVRGVVVRRVDLAGGRIEVDWDPEWDNETGQARDR